MKAPRDMMQKNGLIGENLQAVLSMPLETIEDMIEGTIRDAMVEAIIHSKYKKDEGQLIISLIDELPPLKPTQENK